MSLQQAYGACPLPILHLPQPLHQPPVLLYCRTVPQLLCWELEDELRTKLRARFPSFKHTLWHAALHYTKALRVAAGEG